MTKKNPSLARTGRLEALSDGTFAIIITLLVIEIRRPNAAPGQLAEKLLHEWPSYLAYAVAFINIGVIWLNHHYVFSQLEHTDLTLNWINLGILATASLIPFPTGVLSSAYARPNLADQRTAVVLYALIAFLMSAPWIPLFIHLRRNPAMLKAATDSTYFALEVLRPAVGAAGYLVAAGLGWFVQPIVAVVIFIVIVAYYAATSTGMRSRFGQSRSRRPSSRA